MAGAEVVRGLALMATEMLGVVAGAEMVSVSTEGVMAVLVVGTMASGAGTGTLVALMVQTETNARSIAQAAGRHPKDASGGPCWRSRPKASQSQNRPLCS